MTGKVASGIRVVGPSRVLDKRGDKRRGEESRGMLAAACELKLKERRG